jgi:peptidoglycan/xylan/chitin deacetylase (PgdA/CDA1 family)
MRTLIVGFAWLSPFLLVLLWPYAPITGIAVMALSHALLLYPTLRANVQWLGPVITHFAPNGSEVWLTIDDGPADDTGAILDILASRGLKATFFVTGKRAIQRPEMLRSIVAAGHTVGNHSYSHPSATFWCLPPALIADEIDQCSSWIGAPPYFRAPVGMKNPAVHPALAERGMRLIGWTVRGFDTVTSDPGRVAARIVARVEPGAIIVLHQGRQHSAACIERVIDELQRAGYSLAIPSEDRLKTNR